MLCGYVWISDSRSDQEKQSFGEVASGVVSSLMCAHILTQRVTAILESIAIDPPLSVARLWQNAIFLEVAYTSPICITGPICITILLQRYKGQGSLEHPQLPTWSPHLLVLSFSLIRNVVLETKIIARLSTPTQVFLTLRDETQTMVRAKLRLKLRPPRTWHLPMKRETQTMVWVWGVLGVGVEEGALEKGTKFETTF